MAKILIAEDERDIRDLIAFTLKFAGYDIVTANNGEEAVKLFEANRDRISLVLLDMVMPRMGGLEAFRRLVGLDRSIRVLLCTGYSENDQAQRAIREGALGFLPKPFTMSELLARVEKVLRADASPSR